MAGATDNINGSLRMRTQGEGGLATAYAMRTGGSENLDFGAYVLNGRPLMFTETFHNSYNTD